ncbi:hypothetical protein PR202_ga30951 [Eleusine coracana subsp. coracana]|uniref:Protein kinase domain-containing protein n=1 Tax=Eleusine coracana subsp. coracana TaxID=191504 RepID=A0AAV5DQY3_ELECO|nr:hypothetical protein PR202_ga30951 [Eleusine coracana subsp. coracana]
MSRHARDLIILLLLRFRRLRISSSSSATSLVLLLFVLLVAGAVAPSSAQRQFSTVAISHLPNSTLICALVRTTAGGDGSVSNKLHCKSLPTGEQFEYPSADIPYNAIAAGTDFLCGLMAPHGGHAAMRWWSFSEEAAANRSRPVGRRLYWGPSLRALSAGGPHVCGLSDAHDPACWEWPGLKLPKGMDFSRIALGHDFLCGIVAGNKNAMRCFGGGVKAPRFVASTVAAGHSHACAVDAEGGFACWGPGAPHVPPSELPETMTAMALGNRTTCVLAGNGTAQCWGAVTVPAQYASTSFVSIEADGDAVCGIVASNYSVVCWGGRTDDRFGSNYSHMLVYNDTMPGACVPRSSCKCDIISGSGALCGTGGAEGGVELAVCAACSLKLNASRIVIDNNPNPSSKPSSSNEEDSSKKRKRAVVVAVSVAGAVVAAVGTALLSVVVFRRKWDRKKVHVTVQLGESSSRRLCRDTEEALAVLPRASSSSSPPTRPSRPLGCEEFTLRELSRLTNGFSEDARIGSGSFGCVYRAKLPDGREVAIKRAERRRNEQQHRTRRKRVVDAERAFRSELKLLSRVNHRNLVQLLGFCEERGERILVFEFMPHGALHDHLHNNHNSASLSLSPLFTSWEARLRVALDAARGVEYLHCYAVPAIIHRDVKPSNTSSSTPTGPPSDVYSFGVVLLELVTGRKALHRSSQREGGSGSPRNVIEFAVPAVEAGNIARILDGRVPPPRGHEVEAVARVAKIASECVRPRGRARPIMSEVVAELEWAVTLCEECVVVAANGQGSSRNAAGGSDMSRSRSLSESEDPSPFHTRDLGVGVSSATRPPVLTHGRSHSSAM